VRERLRNVRLTGAVPPARSGSSFA
jgi:hypothetical protein